MYQLERAERKLERIRREQGEVRVRIRGEHDLIPFGQPNIEGRRDIYKPVKRLYKKSRELLNEEEKQERRVDMLHNVKDFKEENPLLKDVHVVGTSSYATIGAKTSVNNIDYFKNKLDELIESNEKAKAYNKTKPPIKMRTHGAEITKLKRKIASLEMMEERDNNKVISEKSQKLIDEKLVNQWLKKPIYYFVKGLRKVALELDEDGNFFVSSRYPAWSDEDKEFVNDLLK